jgi:hypothetical protein
MTASGAASSRIGPVVLAYVGPGGGFLFHGPVPWAIGVVIVFFVWLRLRDRRRRDEAE